MSMNLPHIDCTAQTTQITAFIKSTLKAAGKQTAAIALSGGIDSAVSLALTVKALGLDHVHPLHLPTRLSNPLHTKDVELLLKSLDFPTAGLSTINIGSIIQKTWRTINRNSTNAPSGTPDRKAHNAEVTKHNRLRLANLSARIRMMVLYDFAKQHDALVIGTENYSEHLLGYFTRFGDEASDVEPIRHLYKTQVIELAKHLNIPHEIITKPPSADLWQGQTDENEMGFSYQEADPILYLHDQGQSEAEIVSSGIDAKLVSAVLATVAKNDYKQNVPYKM